MNKQKQPASKANKTPTTRKPSLPIKRNSSIVSITSDKSCLSDRIIYRKNTVEEKSLSIADYNQSNNNISNYYSEQQKQPKYLTSDKSLKKMKSKLSVAGGELLKISEHSLTGFQWLIVMRHCFHRENKHRQVNSIKIRVLTNYIRNKMYPDSLWNKILVVENEKKFSPSQIITTLQKQPKSKLSLDDILVCISRNFSQSMNSQQSQQNDSAAETARFTDNIKPNLQIMQGSIGQNFYSQPKFIYKSSQNKKIQDRVVLVSQQVRKKQLSHKQDLLPINMVSVNSFNVQQQVGVNISPISIISGADQTNDISFSMQESSLPSQIQPELVQPQTSLDQSERFEYGYNAIQALKKNFEKSSQKTDERLCLVNFLEEVLSYSIYKNKKKGKENKSEKRKKEQNNMLLLESNQSFEKTQQFHGLKLETRKNISKLSPEILERLFKLQEFTEYFHNLQAIKISEYYSELRLTLPILSPSLKILNLSDNNLRSISFLKDIQLVHLQFINLNNNKITNMSDLLIFENLEEIHIKHNRIDHVHVGKDKIKSKKLKIIDLAENNIQKEEDLWSLNDITSLQMINLTMNPIMTSFKPIGMLSKQIITQHVQMYVFSAYTQYKDISFTAKQKQRVELREDPILGQIKISKPNKLGK